MFVQFDRKHKCGSRGFAMIEALTMIAVTAAALMVFHRIQINQQVEETNESVAKHALLVQDGVNKMINDYRKSLITSASPAIPGVANPFAPTVAELQATPAGAPYIPQGYNVANQLGMTFSVSLTRLPTGCTPGVNCTDVAGKIMSTASYVDPTSGLPDGARVANVANKIGMDAASSRVGSTSQFVGPAGTWAETNPLNMAGILAIRVGYGSVSYNNLDFLLPRDGSRPMAGTLNMNGNAITGATTIDATSHITTTAGNITTSSGNIATTSGSISTSSGNISTTSGKLIGKYVLPASQGLGSACTDNGALASTSSGMVLICRAGTWQADGGLLSTAGAACSPNGSIATSTSTGEALMCRGGRFITLANAVGKYVEMSRLVVNDGTVVAQPACETGGTPTFRFGMVQTAVDISTAPPKQVTLLSATSGSGNWTVSYKLKDDTGALFSANAYNLQAIMYLECKYP